MKKLITLLVLTLISFSSMSQIYAKVRKGKLDLRNWNPADQTVILLAGEWVFSWQQLSTWDEIISETKLYANFSTPWSEQLIDGDKLPRNGYASYAVELLLPKNITEVSFQVPAVFNSYAMYVNDELISANGKVGTSREEVEPEWKPQAVSCHLQSDTARIVFQISNFQNTRGGSSQAIKLSEGMRVIETYENHKLSGTVVFLLFLFAGVAAVIFYLITRQQNILYFGLLSAALSLRFLFSDLYIYNDFLPFSLSWKAAAKIEYATIPFVIVWAVLFISGKYPSEFKKVFRVSFLVLNILFIALAFIVKTKFLSQFLTMIQVTSIAFLVYSITAIINALLYGRVGAWTSTIGLVIFGLVGIYNIAGFLSIAELNRLVIHIGYTLALILNAIALIYRTPATINSESQKKLRYSDFNSGI